MSIGLLWPSQFVGANFSEGHLAHFPCSKPSHAITDMCFSFTGMFDVRSSFRQMACSVLRCEPAIASCQLPRGAGVFSTDPWIPTPGACPYYETTQRLLPLAFEFSATAAWFSLHSWIYSGSGLHL